MATSAMGAVTVPTTLPSLENQFGLSIGHEMDSVSTGLVVWQNPHLGTPITPYIPSEENESILANCRTAFENTKNQRLLGLLSSEESFFLNHDVSVIILNQLDLTSMINFSEVNKCSYLATKQNIVWLKQLSNLLPSVKAIAPNLCIFTSEQQFKIISKRILNECKPYLAKFNRIQELSITLQNELKSLELQYQEAGGITAASRHGQGLIDIVSQQANNPQFDQTDFQPQMTAYWQNSSDSLTFLLSLKINALRNNLQHLLGANYDGTIQSIDRNSFQGQLMNAIKVRVPNAFDQVKFEEEIRKAEVIKNTSSSNNEILGSHPES